MALILERHIGETVVLSGGITVTVIGIQGNRVRLAFKAPSNIEIYRDEVWQRIQQERQTK